MALSFNDLAVIGHRQNCVSAAPFPVQYWRAACSGGEILGLFDRVIPGARNTGSARVLL
jgi:hypothetical protein